MGSQSRKTNRCQEIFPRSDFIELSSSIISIKNNNSARVQIPKKTIALAYRAVSVFQCFHPKNVIYLSKSSARRASQSLTDEKRFYEKLLVLWLTTNCTL